MLHEALEKVMRRENLSRAETCAVMTEFYAGQVTPSQMAALWTALSMKGMTTEERAAVDEARREHAPTVEGSAAGTAEGYEFGHPKFCAGLVAASMTVARGEDLSRMDAERAMEDILSGNADDVRIAAFLAALRFKGETVDEVVGFAKAMRRHAVPIFPAGARRPDDVIVDTCGTGGDERGTFNVSTAAAFVVAGAGVRVAKHGNRSTSSRCGSADVLEALGVKVEIGAGARGAGDRADRDWVFICAGDAFGYAARYARAARTAHADGFQFAGAADESCGGFGAGRGSLRWRVDRNWWRGRWGNWECRARLWCTGRMAWMKFRLAARLPWRNCAMAWCVAFLWCLKDLVCGGRRWRRFAAGMRSIMRGSFTKFWGVGCGKRRGAA